MTSKTPRICEHEESKIVDLLLDFIKGYVIENPYRNDTDLLVTVQDFSYKITRYLNTKKPCKKCYAKK